MSPISPTTLTTPDGPFTILADEEHVLASGWAAEADQLLQLIHPSLRDELEGAAPTVLVQAEEAVRKYYAGDHAAVGLVPVLQRSGPFRQQAWEALRTVTPGAPITYREYADRSGSPLAVRAAAGACASNAAALFVPCHRIIRTDGSLGGFRYGAEVKQSLLRREATVSV
ncbi:methylated-DNA--[protein]-cysteine S-methyltransferase [Nesterenkonia populi]